MLAEGEELGSNILHLGDNDPPVPRLPWRAHVRPTRPVNLPDVRFTSDSYRAFALQRNDATCHNRL
jgi:hypothetical protein